MFLQIVAITCIIACIIAIFYAWKIYIDTRKIKPDPKDDDDDELGL